MTALVLSTLNGIFIGASLPVSLPFSRATTRSFTVKQHMQRNLSSSLGTRTRLSQHMHLRIALPSSSSPAAYCFFFPLITLPGGKGRVPSGWSTTGTSASSTSPSSAATVPRLPVLLLRPNSFGSGFDAVRLCDALPGERRVGEPGPVSGSRGSGLLLLEAELLLPRCGALLLEDPARMRDDHVGGMAAAARHRTLLRRSEGWSRRERV